MSMIELILMVLFIIAQLAYLCVMLIELYFITRPVNRVDMEELQDLAQDDYPDIILFYPVLRELESTMRTTFVSLENLHYPVEKFRIIAIPNDNDLPTVESLERLAREFPFLSVMPVPPTSDPRWNVVWDDWQANEKAYWFHKGPRAGVRDLPPKKTRQLIYAFYTTYANSPFKGEFLVDYIDADSAPPANHFLAAAVGIRHFDVLQATNIAGNLLDTMPASWFAFDHLCWDANKYGHLTANGHHPYWVLGKGLFFKASDLKALGGFHPWMTIEDPEVGMRFWANGKTLGLIEAPLVEEVPETLSNGITQRKRWVAGFFQSLDTPLKEMGFSRFDRFKAWLNFLPCMSFWLNSLGIPIGIWALVQWARGTSPLPHWTVYLSAFNVLCFGLLLLGQYVITWRRTALVLPSRLKRLWYLIRVNPVSLMIFWLVWMIPLWKGWRMYRKDAGLVWERTIKINANNDIVREIVASEHAEDAASITPTGAVPQAR